MRGLSGLFVAIMLWPGALFAKAPPEEVARLGKDLTAIGAERAGNADGSIPEWTGGSNFTEAQRNLGPKDIEAMDPDALSALFSGGRVDAPLFTITAENLAEHADLLSEGHKAMFARYAEYQMPVYPSLRSGYFPEAIEQATIENAARAWLEGTDTVREAELGFPFPLPQSGAEAIWNHKLKFRGTAVRRFNNQGIVLSDGSYTLSKLIEDVKFKYANLDEPGKSSDNVIFYYMSEQIAPPRTAGQIVLVHEKADQSKGQRDAWLYNPGLRRVRRAPNVGYDNPSEGTDGEQANDQVDMFNGALDRYDWTLKGKREIYIPYNSFNLVDRRVKYADILGGNHINQRLTRYERHRVWVVEANLREGTSHLFRRRVFYLDEDSWSIAMVECYDNRGKLWKFQEGHLTSFPMVPTVTAVPEIIYDLQTGRYFVTAMNNEDSVNDYRIEFDDKHFTTQAMKKRAQR